MILYGCFEWLEVDKSLFYTFGFDFSKTAGELYLYYFELFELLVKRLLFRFYPFFKNFQTFDAGFLLEAAVAGQETPLLGFFDLGFWD